jgi:ribosomal-protein-alanine N-acetyltransferase
MSVPTIKTARLTLRPFTLQDAEPLYQILSIPGVLEYFPSSDAPDLERVKKLVQRQIDHWAEHDFGWWAVEPESNGELIGWSGLQYLPETDEIEIGYLLSKPYWGKGLATESATSGLDFGFNTLNILEIIGIVHPENFASQKVLEKIGLDFQEHTKYFGMECFKYLAENPN